MTRQEAINILAGLYQIPVENGADEFASEINKAIDMALEALESERPSDEVVQCEDAIDRYSALAILNPRSVEYKEMKALTSVLVKSLKDMAIDALQERPKRTETMMVNGEPTEIDPLSYEVGYSHGQSERPKGKWIDDIEYSGWTCTHCNYHDGNRTDNYCPNCGADMRGDK